MKLARLELTAFGPFTDKLLDFSGETPGLHIVFGPNEAGKSSSLRGLKALLYGFDERTRDNFVHANDQLLVGGLLRADDGEELWFQRRKKRKADLLDRQGEPLDSAVLTRFLHGIEPAVFDALFGIDHETLVSGGQDILEQKGDVGRSLFAAGTGIASLRRILNDLQEQSEALFKARGSKPEINQALAEYRELQKVVRDASLAGSEWKKYHQALRDAQSALDQLHVERRDCESRCRHLERLHQALPQLAQRDRLEEQLRQLGEVAPLSEDFAALRRRAQEQKCAAEQRLLTARERLADLEQRAAGIAPSQALLDQAQSIEDLARRLGEYRKGLQDRPALDGRRRQLKSEAAELLRQIRPDLRLEQVENVRPLLARRKTIQQMGARVAALEQSLQGASRQVRRLQDDLEKNRQILDALPAAPHLESLHTAVEQARKAGDLDEAVGERTHTLALEEQSLHAELKRLGLWSGSWQELLELSLPHAATLSGEEDRLRALHQEQSRLQSERRELDAHTQRLRHERALLEAEGEVPTEKDLEQSRRRRNQGWHLLRRRWLHQEDVAAEEGSYHPELALPEAFEQAMTGADQTADRLRREAARVHAFVTLEARAQEIQAQRTQIEAREQERRAALEDFQRQWQALWSPCGITPRAPRDMSLWLTDAEKLRLRVVAWRAGCDELEAQRARRARLRQALVSAPVMQAETSFRSGEALAPVLSHVQEMVARAEQNTRRRADLQERLRQIEDELGRARGESDEAHAALDAWREQWHQLTGDLGLPSNALPGEADDFLDTLQKCFDHLRQAEDFQKRIDGIDRDVRTFSAAVHSLQAQVAPDLKELAVDQTLVQMQAQLTRAREERSRLLQVQEDRQLLAEESRQAQIQSAAAEDELARLCRQAHCAGEDDLERAERLWDEHQRLHDRLADADTRLLQIGEGLSLAELQEQARDVDAAQLPTTIAELRRDLQERIDPETSRLNQLIGEARTELQRMDGSARAALAAEDAERILARLRRLAERYARLRVAARVLDQEIERFRAENQDPLLTIASRRFAALTIGAFAGLRADVGDQGQPILVGERADRRRLEVGAMSSGTRDQLYLALRLASLEWRLEQHEAMPFIVDDILINFDDERSCATLQTLAELAARNQVILFTHHRQVVDTVRSLGEESLVCVHEL